MINITMPYPPLKCYLFTVVKYQAQVKSGWTLQLTCNLLKKFHI